MSSSKIGSGVDTATQARLYFYNELASRYPGAQPQRVRRSRTGDELLKVPKDAIDSLLNRVGFLIKSQADRVPKAELTRVPTKVEETIQQSNAVAIEPKMISYSSPAQETQSGSAAISSASNALMAPVHTIQNSLKHFRTDKYIYVANDAGHTAAKTTFLRFPNRTIVWSIAAVILFALALGSYFFLQQQSANRQNAIEQSQFEEQRQAWQCALQTYELQQGKQLSQEKVCSK